MPYSLKHFRTQVCIKDKRAELFVVSSAIHIYIGVGYIFLAQRDRLTRLELADTFINKDLLYCTVL